MLVLATNNERLPPMWTPRRFLTYLRWAWLVEGAAQYFSGQVSLFRPAVITRLRQGDRPRFPPSRRDAVILGGTVFDLLDRHAGPRACSLLASRLHREGPRGNLQLAFEASMREIEKAWRQHLDEIVYPPEPGAEPLADSGVGSSPLRRRGDAEEAIDLHDLDLAADAAGSGSEGDFDAEFTDPFEGQLRVRRGSGLRSPTGSDLPPAPDLDFGPAPEFGFEGSGAGSVGEPDQDKADRDRGEQP